MIMHIHLGSPGDDGAYPKATMSQTILSSFSLIFVNNISSNLNFSSLHPWTGIQASNIDTIVIGGLEKMKSFKKSGT